MSSNMYPYNRPTEGAALSVTANGEISLAGANYSSVIVNVPNPSTGTLSVVENGEYDVTAKATAAVNVPAYLLQYNVNGGTGAVAPQAVAFGSSTTAAAGDGLTPPSEKTFAGWGLTDSAEEADYTAGATIKFGSGENELSVDTTLYAVWTSSK